MINTSDESLKRDMKYRYTKPDEQAPDITKEIQAALGKVNVHIETAARDGKLIEVVIDDTNLSDQEKSTIDSICASYGLTAKKAIE